MKPPPIFTSTPTPKAAWTPAEAGKSCYTLFEVDAQDFTALGLRFFNQRSQPI
jgi:hypothetical protein